MQARTTLILKNTPLFKFVLKPQLVFHTHVIRSSLILAEGVDKKQGPTSLVFSALL